MTNLALVGDIGGTNSRFGLMKLGSMDVEDVEVLKNDNFRGLEDALSHYVGKRGITELAAAAVDVAAPVDRESITLTNRGGETVQLKTRHWRITDANGKLQEVRGAGVVGEQPILKPGANYEYTSGVPLPTPSGFMTGSYGMVTETGEPFDIEIPAFSLDMPEGARTIN